MPTVTPGDVPASLISWNPARQKPRARWSSASGTAAPPSSPSSVLHVRRPAGAAPGRGLAWLPAPAPLAGPARPPGPAVLRPAATPASRRAGLAWMPATPGPDAPAPTPDGPFIAWILRPVRTSTPIRDLSTGDAYLVPGDAEVDLPWGYYGRSVLLSFSRPGDDRARWVRVPGRTWETRTTPPPPGWAIPWMEAAEVMGRAAWSLANASEVLGRESEAMTRAAWSLANASEVLRDAADSLQNAAEVPTQARRPEVSPP